jgi:hypothetical protein
VSTLLVLLALAAVPVQAPDAGRTVQPESVERQVLPGKVRLGEPFVYRLDIRHPSTQRWELRTPRDLGSFELLEQSRSRQDDKGHATTTYLLKMAMFAIGEQVMPTLTFDVVEPDGASVATLDGPDIEGLSSLPKNAEQLGMKLEDIKPNEDVPVRSWRLLFWLAGVLALVALALLARRAWLRRALPSAPPLPPLPLAERTRRALDALEAEHLPERGMQREFHFQLSGVVRGYLGERFGFDALECTSGELVREVEHRALPGVEFGALQRFVDQCDVARYARAEVPVPACAAVLAWARSLLATTAPPEPVEPAVPPEAPTPSSEPPAPRGPPA